MIGWPASSGGRRQGRERGGVWPWRRRFVSPWWLARGLVLGCLLAVGPWLDLCYGDSLRVEQYQLEAVYLYNFLHFITWPAVIKRADQPSGIVVGVVGETPLIQALADLTTKAEQMNRIPVRLVTFAGFSEGADFSGCDILFVSAAERGNYRKIIESLKQAPVLTVADTVDFLAAGGMIAMVEQQNRIRYQVNRRAAAEAGLRLSSQLLKTAIDVQSE